MCDWHFVGGGFFGTLLEATIFPDSFCHACRAPFCSNTGANILQNLLGLLQTSPNTGLKKYFDGETLQRSDVRQNVVL